MDSKHGWGRQKIRLADKIKKFTGLTSVRLTQNSIKLKTIGEAFALQWA